MSVKVTMNSLLHKVKHCNESEGERFFVYLLLSFLLSVTMLMIRLAKKNENVLGMTRVTATVCFKYT